STTRGRARRGYSEAVDAVAGGHGIEEFVAAGGAESDPARRDDGGGGGDLVEHGGAVGVEELADDGAALAPIDFETIPVVGLTRLSDGGEVREAVADVGLE